MSNNELRFSKTETEAIRVTVELARLLEYVYETGREYQLNAHVRPSRPNGFAYQASVAGQSGTREPRWPKTLGATVVDGSVTWTAVAVDSNSSDSVSSVNIPAVSGLTISAPATSGTRTTFDVSGGENGRTYEISFEVTTSANEVFEEKITVEIDGE